MVGAMRAAMLWPSKRQAQTLTGSLGARSGGHAGGNRGGNALCDGSHSNVYEGLGVSEVRREVWNTRGAAVDSSRMAEMDVAGPWPKITPIMAKIGCPTPSIKMQVIWDWDTFWEVGLSQLRTIVTSGSIFCATVFAPAVKRQRIKRRLQTVTEWHERHSLFR
eukprot:1193240-Prorocentrum_minimum.AAC.2